MESLSPAFRDKQYSRPQTHKINSSNTNTSTSKKPIKVSALQQQQLLHIPQEIRRQSPDSTSTYSASNAVGMTMSSLKSLRAGTAGLFKVSDLIRSNNQNQFTSVANAAGNVYMRPPSSTMQSPTSQLNSGRIKASTPSNRQQHHVPATLDDETDLYYVDEHYPAIKKPPVNMLSHPDEITKQLVKQNLMIFNRKRLASSKNTATTAATATATQTSPMPSIIFQTNPAVQSTVIGQMGQMSPAAQLINYQITSQSMKNQSPTINQIQQNGNLVIPAKLLIQKNMISLIPDGVTEQQQLEHQQQQQQLQQFSYLQQSHPQQQQFSQSTNGFRRVKVTTELKRGDGSMLLRPATAINKVKPTLAKPILLSKLKDAILSGQADSKSCTPTSSTMAPPQLISSYSEIVSCRSTKNEDKPIQFYPFQQKLPRKISKQLTAATIPTITRLNSRIGNDDEDEDPIQEDTTQTNLLHQQFLSSVLLRKTERLRTATTTTAQHNRQTSNSPRESSLLHCNNLLTELGQYSSLNANQQRQQPSQEAVWICPWKDERVDDGRTDHNDDSIDFIQYTTIS